MSLHVPAQLQAWLSDVCARIEASDISHTLKQELNAQATVYAAVLDDITNCRLSRTAEGETEMLDAINEFCALISAELGSANQSHL